MPSLRFWLTDWFKDWAVALWLDEWWEETILRCTPRYLWKQKSWYRCSRRHDGICGLMDEGRKKIRLPEGKEACD